MVIVIVSLLNFLYTLHSSLGHSYDLLQPRNKVGMCLTQNPCENHNIYEVRQLLPENKLSWREVCA